MVHPRRTIRQGDLTAVPKAFAVSPNRSWHTDPFDAFDPAGGWVGFAVDAYDGLGAHSVTAIPEPESWVLVGGGIMALAAAARARRRTRRAPRRRSL